MTAAHDTGHGPNQPHGLDGTHTGAPPNHRPDDHGHSPDHAPRLTGQNGRSADGAHDHAPRLADQDSRSAADAHDHGHRLTGQDSHSADDAHDHAPRLADQDSRSANDAHDHGHRHGGGHAGHDHGVAANADGRWLGLALALIGVFMLGEVVAGLVAHSLALLSDAAHMLTDAGAIVLALVAMRLAARPPRGGYTYGLKRAEILSAQANGLTMLILAVWLGIEAARRLIHPPAVTGTLVLVTALVGIAVNVVAAWAMSRANRSSLNVEGAFQHVLNDLWAFVATAVAGVVVITTGFTRADPIATLVVVVLMARAGLGLVRESGKIFMEAAPPGLEPEAVGGRLAALDPVVEVHDLHIWQITSGQPALSAHILVDPDCDCHAIRVRIEQMLRTTYKITHSTLQVDHYGSETAILDADEHCVQPHGASYRSVSP